MRWTIPIHQSLRLTLLAISLVAFGALNSFAQTNDGFISFDELETSVQQPLDRAETPVQTELTPQQRQAPADPQIYKKAEPTGILFTEPLGDRNLGEGVIILDKALVPEGSLLALQGKQGRAIELRRYGLAAFAALFDSDEEAEQRRTEILFRAALDQRDPPVAKRVTLLRALDKITARMTEIELPVGQSVQFGTLNVTARVCYENPQTETPESATFLEIVDQPVSRDEYQVFEGWMFASSPALSAMDHPIYDIWIVGCSDGA